MWPTNSAGIVADDSIRLYPVPLPTGLARATNHIRQPTPKRNIDQRNPQIRKKCSTMPQLADTQRLNTCPALAIAAATCTSVKCRSVPITDCPTTPYAASGRVHGSRQKSKGGRNFVLSPIRKTASRRNPLPHNTFRQTATPTNREISILEQKTDRHLPPNSPCDEPATSGRSTKKRELFRIGYPPTTSLGE